MQLPELTEEQIAQLIAILPPAPGASVRAAQLLPAAKAALGDTNSRTEGQGKSMSHPPTTHDLDSIAGSLDRCLEILTAAEPEVQSHALSHMLSEAQVKQAIEEIKDALAQLRQIAERGA